MSRLLLVQISFPTIAVENDEGVRVPRVTSGGSYTAPTVAMSAEAIVHLGIVQTEQLRDRQILAADLAMAVVGLIHPQVAYAQLFK